MKHPSLIVLNALLKGQEIVTKNNTYLMSEDNQFGVKVTDDNGESCVMVTDYSINWLIKFSESLSQNELTLLTCNNVLNSIPSQNHVKP